MRDIPKERMDAVDMKVMSDIGQYGWSDMGVFPTQEDPGLPFNYTIGLAEYEHPDLIVLGLVMEQAHGVLSSAYDQIKGGTRFAADEYYDEVLVGLPVGFVEVLDPMGDYPMSMTRRLYGEVHALQLVWPDQKSHFPWDSDFDPDCKEHQPLLGVWRGV